MKWIAVQKSTNCELQKKGRFRLIISSNESKMDRTIKKKADRLTVAASRLRIPLGDHKEIAVRRDFFHDNEIVYNQLWQDLHYFIL